MVCPKCGYVLDPFEKDCPRCARRPASPPAHRPSSFADEPHTAEPPPPPGVPLASKITEAAQDTAKSIEVVPLVRLPGIDEPDLGWPLAIFLWLVMALNGAIIVYWVAAAIGVQLIFNSEEATHTAGMTMFFFIFNPSLRLLGAIGLYRGMRWGFYLFCLFSVLPAFWDLMANGLNNPVKFALEIVPALAIFMLALVKWDRLE